MTSAPRRRFWRLETGCFLFLILVFWWIFRGQAFLDPGTLWHSAVGDYMIDTGRLIERDPFSFTFGGQPWLPHQWLAEVIEAGLHRSAGWDGLMLAGITLLAWGYSWVARQYCRAGGHWLVAVLVLVLAISASRFHLVLRPHLVTIALLGWTIGKLCDVDACQASLRSLWWFVPVYILWTNLHGGVLGGIATLGLTVIGWKVAQLCGWPTPLASVRQRVEATLLVVACMLTVFVTPYGARLAQVWVTIMSAGLSKLVIEHMSLWALWQDPGRREMVTSTSTALLVLAAVYFVALFSCRVREWRVTWLLPLPWLILGVTSVRHLPLFAVAAAVVLADVVPHMRWTTHTATDSESNEKRVDVPSLAPWLIPLGVIMLAFIGASLWHTKQSDPERGGLFVRLPDDAWPFDLLPTLRSYDGKDTRIFNEDLFGGFLMRFVPGLPVFIDDRYEIYGNRELYYRDGRTFLEEYIDALTHHPEHLAEWTQRYGLNLALTQRFRNVNGDVEDSTFGKYLRSPEAKAAGWRLIKETPAAALFERRPEKKADS